jgi:hypothetical protein
MWWRRYKAIKFATYLIANYLYPTLEKSRF